MKLSRLVLWPTVCACLALALARKSAGSQAPATTPDPADARLVEGLASYVDALAQADLFSGAVRLVRDEELLCERYAGEASKAWHVPNRADTRFSLASVSKMFTAVLVAQCVEAGLLGYEDPVGRHLPELGSSVLRERVRIVHLLTHSSGLGDLFGEEWESSPRTAWCEVDDWMRLLREAEPEFEPGQRVRYSNAGYLLLGAVLERVSGRKYAELLEQRIFQPAGMTRSGLFAGDEPIEGLAEGYTRERYGAPAPEAAGERWWSTLYARPFRGSPAGGAWATAEDMTRFLLALRRGKLLSAASLARLLEPCVELAPGGPRYGYGFLLQGAGLTSSYGHEGDFPGASTLVRHYPEAGLSLVVLANYGDGIARRIAEAFEILLRGDGLALPLGFTSATSLSSEDRRKLLEPEQLVGAQAEPYVRVARALIEAVNAEDRAAYERLMAPGFLAGLAEDDPWKCSFERQLAGFGRIERAWAPRRGALEAGHGVRFAGHAGGVSIVVRFEQEVAGALTFSLDDQGLVCAGSCWFQRRFAAASALADEQPIFELR